MNILQKGAHSMRIIALPFARVKTSQGVKINPSTDFNANAMLVFYHFDLISPCGGREDLSWHKKTRKRVMNKVADLWTSLGKAPKGSWKLWTYELGERIADRLDFEELVLRSVDPSLGPTGSNEQANESQILHSFPKIPLIYPPSLYPASLTVGTNHALHPALAHLQTLLSSRGPRHRRGFYLWMLVAPLTVPITLIPIIPNLPLFFCVWRSWSHYRAYRSSQYLSCLLDRRLIEPNPSIELDKLYASITPSGISQSLPPPTLPPRSSENKSTIRNAVTDRKSETASGTGEPVSECILLTRKAIPLILAIFRLPESAAVNMYRAWDQARGRLAKSL